MFERTSELAFVETISVESMRCPKSAVTMRNEELLLSPFKIAMKCPRPATPFLSHGTNLVNVAKMEVAWSPVMSVHGSVINQCTSTRGEAEGFVPFHAVDKILGYKIASLNPSAQLRPSGAVCQITSAAKT
ncbi:CUGBP Elav-like family member 2 [Fukomys damarensis]|uniref:CUGBP Elav-like family member 2 n=1 Tax=Fukomys damarensis TaxID=885580 RepID=A0A091DTS5_FUKDA|nr:CUGBP Elav-like family member 2 [Fukomys damarensis]